MRSWWFYCFRLEWGTGTVVGIGGPLRHSCEALDSRRARAARQPLADLKGYSRIDIHKSGCVLASVLGIGGCTGSHGTVC